MRLAPPLSLPRRRLALAAAAAVAVTVPAVPATPATAAQAAVPAPATAAPPPPAEAAPACALGSFTARSQADLVKVTVLDPGRLDRRLPALADVRLATARSDVDSTGRPHRATATGRYADAKLLGLQVPGLPLNGTEAIQRAPGGAAEPATVSLAELNAGGLATVQAGKSRAGAQWDGDTCARPGTLTGAATMLAGVSVLDGSRGAPGMRAVDRTGGATHRTSLLRLGPTGSTQSGTEVVRLPGGRLGVSAGAGVALTDVTLFGGTPQEISVKVVTQPTLTVVAGGGRGHSSVTYRPAVLDVTAAGRPVTTLTAAGDSVGLDLFGRMSSAARPALFSVRLSLGRPTQQVTDRAVRAEAAAVRLEVTVGAVRLLDVAIGHLSAEASRTPQATTPTRTAGTTGRAAQGDAVAPRAVPTGAAVPAEPAPAGTTDTPVRSAGGSGGSDGGGLALTGADVTALAAGGGALLVLGTTALLLVRRRRRHVPAP